MREREKGYRERAIERQERERERERQRREAKKEGRERQRWGERRKDERAVELERGGDRDRVREKIGGREKKGRVR